MKSSQPITSSLLGSKSELRIITTLEYHELALEENIAKDIDPDTRARLNATEAGRSGVIDRRVIDIAAWNNSGVIANTEANVRESGTARISEATLLLVVGRAVD